jgi:DNA-binding YbaB/EbfC family protein
MNPLDMFRGMGALAGLMKNLPKIKEEMEQLQGRLGQLVAEGDAGAGMVKVRCNGRMEIMGVTLTEDAFKGNDREMLEDLIRAAVNQAIARAKQMAAEETSKMASNLGLPAGMNLPGMPS